ncbi:MAG: ribose 5-phosphate isomerase A [Deltaproteobacteria bacterium]
MDDPRILQEKRAVARAAATLIPDGCRLGLGSGSTAELFLRELGRRVRAGLRVEGVPTSLRSERLARRLGISTVELDERPLDLAVDGSDEVDGQLRLVKGRGGALVRERIVAAAAKRFLVLIDSSKRVRRLGAHAPLPIEIARFGHRRTLARLRERLPEAALRERNGRPFISDNGGLLVDAPLPQRTDPEALDQRLRAIPGVVDTGFFFDFPVELVAP